jgi:hypothetical protein
MPIIASRASAAYGAGFAAITAPPYLGPFGAYDNIAAVAVPSGGVSSITFDGIPTGYKHLQIRGIVLTSGATNPTWRVNGDATSGNYKGHHLWGPGAGNAAANDQSGTVYWNYNPSASFPSAFIMDWLDYASTTKLKTMRTFAGSNTNGGTDEVALWSGLYMSTNAINSITLNGNGANFSQHSHFALYGVK